jgi:hypothetical protein
LKRVGDNRKSSDHDLGAEEAVFSDPFMRSWVIRLEALGSLDGSGGRRDGSIGLKNTEGKFMSSRASLMVKAA